MRFRVLDAKSLHASRFADIGADNASGKLAVIAQDRRSRFLLLDRKLESVLLEIDTDATKISFSGHEELIAINGSSPMLITRDGAHSSIPLRDVCGGMRAMICHFTGVQNEVVVWTQASEIILLAADRHQVAVRNRFRVPGEASVLQVWSYEGESYVSTWEATGNSADFSVVRLRDGVLMVSTQRFRSPPVRIDSGWLAIVDSGIYNHDAKVEDLMTGETSLKLPCDDGFICMASPGTSGDAILQEHLTISGAQQSRSVAVWSLRQREPICKLKLGKGRAVLCGNDDAVAATEVSPTGSALSVFRVADGQRTAFLGFEEKFFYVSCLDGQNRLLIVDDQLGSTSKCVVAETGSEESEITQSLEQN